MNYLTFFTLIVGMQVLAGCNGKSDDSGNESESASSGTTVPADTTSSTGDDGSTGVTTGTVPTTGEDSGDSTASDTGTTAPPADDDCTFLIGKKFVSKKQWPCGPPEDPNDPGPLCPDRVSFDADTFQYMSGDFGISGTYACEAGVITGTGDDVTEYSGTIDAASAALMWDGNEYDVEP